LVKIKTITEIYYKGDNKRKLAIRISKKEIKDNNRGRKA
jgi:hypothetical protein